MKYDDLKGQEGFKMAIFETHSPGGEINMKKEGKKYPLVSRRGKRKKRKEENKKKGKSYVSAR